MKISFDPGKREATLRERGLDFVDAGALFDPPSFTIEDARFDYGEPRYITKGLLRGRLTLIAWTSTDNGIRVISMRKCNVREQADFAARMG